MANSRIDGQIAARGEGDKGSARKTRTARRLGCESLEGRKLMTAGFADPGMMMPHHVGIPADVSTSTADGSDKAKSGDDASADRQAGDPGMMHTMGEPGRDRGMGGVDGVMFPGRFDGGMMGKGMGDRPGGDMADEASKGDGGPGDLDTTNAAVKAASDKLHTDEQAIHDKSEVTPVLLAAVRKDMEAIKAAATGTADATAQSTLDADRKAAFTNQGGPTDAQMTQITADQAAVWKSQGVSQSLIDQLATDQAAVKTASNFTDADKATLQADRDALKAAIDAAKPADASKAGGTDASTADASTNSATSSSAADTSTSAASSTATDSSTSAAATTTATDTSTATATPSATPADASASATPADASATPSTAPAMAAPMTSVDPGSAASTSVDPTAHAGHGRGMRGHHGMTAGHHGQHTFSDGSTGDATSFGEGRGRHGRMHRG